MDNANCAATNLATETFGIAELTSWLERPQPTRFPYDAVVGLYLRSGKHFVPEGLLKALALARETLPEPPDADPDSALLRQFLRTALDKWDGCYDYTTYTALGVLPLPGVDDPPAQACNALAHRDRLVVQLVADTLGFELEVADGRISLLPEMRPDAATTNKRYRLARHVATPALQRLGMAARITATDAAQAARQLCAAVQQELSPQDRRILQLSMLPVYVSHDEYLFIRVLQLFETTFAMLAVQLRTAVHVLTHDDCATAISCVDVAETVLRESAPLFSLLATMQVESFRTFRDFTEGASAIQSRNYKIVESLCRKPDHQRLDSAAYLSVPEIRERVLAGNATLDEVFTSACASQRLTAAEQGELTAAMDRFSATLLRWRQTHYRLAVRMLGERSGTGYTDGTPYLKSVRTIPVFRSIENSRGDVRVESA
jgi:tryptophan 2,3-dioxygenase